MTFEATIKFLAFKMVSLIHSITVDWLMIKILIILKSQGSRSVASSIDGRLSCVLI
jgi:hypothetical protein